MTTKTDFYKIIYTTREVMKDMLPATPTSISNSYSHAAAVSQNQLYTWSDQNTYVTITVKYR